MTRHLDLDRVKQAWVLRREGKQQKEIADALGLSLRHIQNYLSLDWLAQRSLRALLKGGAEEANEQLKALWGLGEAGFKSNVPGSDGDAETGLEPDDGSGDGALSTCRVPENWPDVGRLEEWGVPKYTAPGVLSAWRRAHRDGTHELCALWANLADNIQAKIPFADAYDLAMARWLADRWGVELLRTITELYRLYRPWEGKVHRRVYLDEVRSAMGDEAEDGSSTQLGTLFEGLPRRFLYGLPRRSHRGGHGPRYDRDDRDD